MILRSYLINIKKENQTLSKDKAKMEENMKELQDKLDELTNRNESLQEEVNKLKYIIAKFTLSSQNI